jgi:signal transduction histidine kinase
MMNPEQQLSAAIWEADRHLVILTDALNEWARTPLTDLAAIEADRERLRLVDQILFRFTKLQDALGERLIPATLAVLNEPFERWPMRDRLNRLEKLGFLDVESWLRWREMRNRLAHEYPDSPALRLAAIQAAIQGASDMADAYRIWRSKL